MSGRGRDRSLINDVGDRIVNAITGELLSELTIDLEQDDQPRK